MPMPLEAIRAYFDALDSKIKFITHLEEQGRHDEALLLCCSYIEALGTHLYWPSKDSKRNFVRALHDHGGSVADPLRLVHPVALLRALPGPGKSAAAIARTLEPRLSAERELLTPANLLSAATPLLDPAALQELERLTWLGTLAAIAYGELRCAFVHRGGGPKFVSFDLSHVNRQPAPDLDFPLLLGALRNVAEAARELSLSTGKWFGH